MSKTLYTLYETSALSDLVDRAAAGEVSIIAKAGKPLAKLVPISLPRKPRVPGGWQGRIRIAEDFDDALPDDILAGFEGRD